MLNFMSMIYVVGIQKNHFNELLSTQNICEYMGKKIIAILQSWTYVVE